MKKLIVFICLVLFTGIAYAADVKVSALPELATTPAGSDTLYIIDDTTSKKITVTNLLGSAQGVLTNSAGLRGALSDETGTGLAVFGTSPILITPALGTPSALVLTNATGLPYTGIADGTDGQLITWGADGSPAVVAVGTANQVLTSNGAGAAPTFQAATGGVADGSFLEIKLDATNEPTDNYLLSVDTATGGFTWVAPGSGSGDLLADGTVPLTANWDVGAYTITGTRFISDIAIGTSPFAVTSTTVCTNLNADLLDGESASAFEDADAAIVKSDENETISGDWTFSGSLTIGSIASEDWVTAAMMANGDHGAFTYASNVAALDANTVDSDQYVDGSIDNAHLADDAVNSDEIADGAVDSVHLASISESVILAEPDELQGISDAWMIKYFPAETYPTGVVIDAIHITSSATCTDVLNFEEWTQSGTASSSTVEEITLSGTFTEDDGTLADSAIAADGRLMVDLPATPTDIAFLEITVVYHAN